MINVPKVSVVILNAFKMDDLIECLDSLKNTNYPDFETIVIDCLTPDIEDIIGSKYSYVRLITLKEDIGPAAMHNVGIEVSDSSSKYIAFLDNDTVCDKNWLIELVKCIEMDGLIGAVQAKIMLYDKPLFLNTGGNKANYLAVGWPDGYGESDAAYNNINEIAFPSGAAMIMKKDLLKKVGMYDSDYFIYADDLDAGLRIKLAGYKILYCPKSVVYHKYRFFKNRRNFYFLNRNRIQTYLKLYERRTYYWLLPPQLAYEFSIFVYAMINGYYREYFRSYLYIFQNFGKIRSKRVKIKEFKAVSDKYLIDHFAGAIDFSEINQIVAVKYILNPFLNYYKLLCSRVVS